MKKIISAVLIVAMMLSAVACGKENSKETSKKSKSDSTSTTKESVVEDTLLTEESETEATQVTSEPNQTLPSDVNISETSETTEQPQPGKYTYTVYEGTEYEETFTLDVNIDEYFYVAEGNGERYFDLPRLCKELGLDIICGKFDSLLPEGEHSGEAILFRDESRGMCIRIMPFMKNGRDCYEYFEVQFFTPSEENYYKKDEIAGQFQYYTSVAVFKSSDLYAYIDGLNGYSKGLSYDGIVILTYCMEYIRENPGENPFYYTGWDGSTNSSDSLRYDLPY